MGVEITARSVKGFYTLAFTAAKEETPWMQFVSPTTTNQPGGEEYGYRDPGSGVQEEGLADGAYETPIYGGFHVPNRRFNIKRVLTREDVEFNRVSKAQDVTREMAELAVSHPQDLVEEILLNAHDLADPVDSGSVKFFATDHSRFDGLANQSNLFSGDGTHTQLAKLAVADTTDPTDAEWFDILFGLAMKVKLMTNKRGQRIQRNTRKFSVLVGPTLWPSLVRALSKLLILGGESNVVIRNLAGITFTPGMLPGLASNRQDEIFFSIDNAKAMIMQQLEGSTLSAIRTIMGEHYEVHDEMLLKGRGVYNVALGYYTSIAKGKLTAKGS